MEKQKMKAVKFLGEGKTQVDMVPMPELTEGKVLVKILASAVCGSERNDWMEKRAEGEYILSGHEAVGEIVDANGSRRWREGDRVCIQIMNGCGECYYCKRGLMTFCKDMKYEGGAHAQYMALPENCVIAIDRDIPPSSAVLLGGDLLGVAKRATRQLPIRPGQTVFVSGGGPVGLGVMFMLKALGAKVILSEPGEFRRKYAQEKLGVDVVLDPSEQDVEEELMKLTEGIGPEITIECSGNAVAQTQALDWTRCQGHVMFCGENYKGLNIVPSVQIIHKELNIHGAFYFNAGDVPENVQMYRSGMDPKKLISHVVKIEDAPAAIDEFFAGRTGKVIILPNGGEEDYE